MKLSSLPLRNVVEVLQITTDRYLKHYGMRSAFVGSDSMVSIEELYLPLVSKNLSQKLLNASVLEQRSRLFIGITATQHCYKPLEML